MAAPRGVGEVLSDTADNGRWCGMVQGVGGEAAAAYHLLHGVGLQEASVVCSKFFSKNAHDGARGGRKSFL